MERDQTRTIVLVCSPQNSKDRNLPQIDLLSNPIFENTVRQFDSALGLGPNQSLSEDNQFASVVMSVASHKAFSHGLRERLQPGQVYPRDNKFQFCYMGHSVGEMGALILAGVTDIGTMAWILSERQKITEQPFAEGAMRFMMAVVGVDLKKFEKEHIKPLKEAFGNRVQIVLANKNTPSQGVISGEAEGEDPRKLAKSLTELFSSFQHPNSPRPPRFIPLPEIKNAFHSLWLKPEQVILQTAIAQRYSRNNFRVPSERVIYSPMLGRWIKSDKDAWNVVNNQLTSGVAFGEGVVRVVKDEKNPIFVTADVKGVTPGLLTENTNGQSPIVNIEDSASLDKAVEQTVYLIAQPKM